MPTTIHAEQTIHHKIIVTIDPTQHRLQIEDTITFPKNVLEETAGQIDFLLHTSLHATATTKAVTLSKKTGPQNPAPKNIYTLTIPPGKQSVHLKYEGEIYHPLSREGEEYARSFTETPGLISNEGIYLAGSTAWYPRFDNYLMSFTIDIELPPSWNAVSQGQRTLFNANDETVNIRWESPEPQDEIFLIGGRFTEYKKQYGPVEIMAFLQTPDEGLANTYLTTTTQYLEMYNRLLGPYLYQKFALVENFWETGYGMPSFTLLGPKVIRFPFILHSSYPHEILHNWWGRGVYVDFDSGNWSEGLTTYLADHLIKEQRGTAVDYRRSTLQQYTDYVATTKDFPLTEFRGRHSAATQAIGYGKALMLFHMLRQQLGDEIFIQGLRTFYRDNKFRHATYDDLQKAFEQVSKQDLNIEFAQWVTQSGAPILRVGNARVQPNKSQYHLVATIEQTQTGAPYTLNLPIAISGDKQDETYQTTVTIDSRDYTLDLQVPFRPLHLHIDPEFDVFRRLHRNEVPPALTQAFGAEKVIILLPGRAPPPLLAAYRKLAESWKSSQASAVSIHMDNEFEKLPEGYSIWLFGYNNRFTDQMAKSLSEYDLSITPQYVQMKEQHLSYDTHSIVLSARRQDNPDLALTWVTSDNIKALPGLGRKLPHYGKYSYLAFEGEDPTNTVKGQWPIVNSPLSVAITLPDGPSISKPPMKLAPRTALALLPEVFSKERMMDTITHLTDQSLLGRGLGTPELNRVTAFLANEFHKTGLQPLVGTKNYLQTWQDNIDVPPYTIDMHNVIGIIPGTNPQLKNQSVVIGAHYDHLGLGWPDVHAGDAGKVHPGADDNASGIAVLLELAQVLNKTFKPERTIIFVAFTGEEAGLRGSKYYVNNTHPFETDKIIGMINLDTVGRLEDKKLLVIGTGSAKEWIHVFMGVGYVTGIPIQSIATDFGSSDQKSFIDAGIPAIQFFTGPHLDYHRPTDTKDKIDPAGLVKVAKATKETIQYLANRPKSLTSTLQLSTRNPGATTPQNPSNRKVSLGTIPDFSYQDHGVKITGTTPNSPAEKAGLQPGDVLVKLGETTIINLKTFSDVLATMQPGDTIAITFTRQGQEHTTKAIVVIR